MGFFVPDEQVKALETAKKPSARKKAGPELGETGCDACSLKGCWPSLLSPRMALGGPVNADILVLGAAPSAIDDQQGQLWQGETGKLLRDELPRRQMDRLAFQSISRCYPIRGQADLKSAHACSTHLTADVEQSSIKAILGVGDLGLRYFTQLDQRYAQPPEQLHEIYGTKLPVRLGSKVVWYWPVFDPFYVISKAGKYDDGPVASVFKADIKRFFNEVDSWGNAEIVPLSGETVLLPRSYEEAKAIIARMEGPLGVDIETSALKPMIIGAKILTAAFSDGDLTCAFPVQHPENPNDWGERLMLETLMERQWIAHNAAFELVWFLYSARRAGYDIFSPAVFQAFHDSMALGRLYHERSLLLDLGTLSRIHLGVNIKTLSPVDPKRIMQFPLVDVLPYNGIDAQASALIWRKLHPIIDRQHRANYQRFLDAIYATAMMELMGLPVDLDKSESLRAQWSGQSAGALQGLKRIYEVKAFEQARQVEFNIQSGEHVGEALAVYGKLDLPKTEGGKQYSTDEDLLRKLAPDNPLVKAVLAVREGEKMVSTYIDPIASVPTRYDDGLLHPGYTTMHTATTRLSSGDPNIQNFPKRKHKELREQIVAPKGKLFYAFDFGQLEARVLAMVTQDRNLCDGIIKGRDIHTDWLNNCIDIYPDYLDRLAQETGQTEEKKIRKYGRDIIKTDFVFASFYGSGANAVSTRTRIPRHLVDELHTEFWREFKGVKDWIKSRRQYYAQTGSSELLTKIVRHTVLWGNEPINTPIQGTAACIVVDAMNDLSRLARETNDPIIHPRVNIHDDLMFCLPEDADEAEPYVRGIMETMVEIRYDWQIVPLMVEAKVGPTWADLEEFTTYTGDYVR